MDTNVFEFLNPIGVFINGIKITTHFNIEYSENKKTNKGDLINNENGKI